MLEFFDNVILSPGPGSPHKDFDSKVLESATIPVLGVCLGHQGIGVYYGSKVGHGLIPMHGRITQMSHNGNELFDGIPKEFLAVEYHSLVIQKIKEPLEVICTGPGDVIMGIKHSTLPFYGVQFHPEVCVYISNYSLFAQSMAVNY
jgi:para-aminobenzoate synthetase